MLDLKNYDEPILRCSRCEFCQSTCPVYLEDLLETHLARARVNLIQACLLEESMPVSDRFKEIVDRCLLCTNCSQTCPAGIPVDEIVVSARSRLYSGKRKGIVQRNLMRNFMEQRGFGGVLGAAQSLAAKIGWSREELPAISDRPFSERQKGIVSPEGEVRGRVAYFVGCATNSFYPETAEDVIKVMTQNGIEVVIPEGLVCCGLPALVEGDIETAQEMTRKNFEVLAGQEVDAIITDCTSCGMMLKVKAARSLQDDDPIREKFEMLAFKVWETTDYLTNKGLSAEPPAMEEKVTYHVPCHRGWTDNLKEAPRTLLEKIPHAELIEMEYPEKCCGSGGTFFMDYRDLSQSIRSKKIEDINRTGAKTVLTQCPACRSYLTPALPEHKVMHPVSFLARAYGL